MSLVPWQTLILKGWDDPDIAMLECWKKISKNWTWFQWLLWTVTAVHQLPSYSPHNSLGLSQAQCPDTLHSISQNLLQSHKQRILQLDGFQKAMESDFITWPKKKQRLRELTWLFQVPQLVIVRSGVNTLQIFAQVEKEPMVIVTISLKLCWPQRTSESAREQQFPRFLHSCSLTQGPVVMLLYPVGNS